MTMVSAGSFVLMVVRITSNDLPVFVVIYTIFLFGFVAWV